MRKLILYIIVLISAARLTAQDGSVNSQYLINPYYINPAAAGMNGLNNFHGSYRTAMNSLPNNPTTYYVSYDGLIGKKVGMGAMLMNDKVASLNKYRMQLSYAYNWFASEGLRMGVGLNAEFHQLNLDKKAGDNSFQQPGDAAILAALDGNQYFDATAGVYGVYKDKLSFGVSVPNLVRARLNKGNDEELSAFETAFQYFAANVGYRFDSKEYDFAVEPSLMVRKSFDAPIITDVNLKTYFLKNTLMTGATLRIIDKETLVGLLVGAKFGALSVYYNYDVSFQQTQKYHAGTHEFSVGFEFAGKKKMDPQAEEKKMMEANPPMPAK